MLSKFLSNLINRKANSTDESKFANLTKFEQAKELIEKLSQKKGKLFSPIFASQQAFQVIDANLEHLILRLMQYVQTLEAGGGLTTSNCYTEYHVVTLDKYFTDDDGNYIPSSALLLFVATCQSLFAVLEKMAKTNQSEFNYHERLLTKSFISIQNICIAVDKTTQ